MTDLFAAVRDPLARSVYMAMAALADCWGVVRVPTERVAKLVRCNREQVIVRRRMLVEAGLLELVFQSTGRVPSVYRLLGHDERGAA